MINRRSIRTTSKLQDTKGETHPHQQTSVQSAGKIRRAFTKIHYCLLCICIVAAIYNYNFTSNGTTMGGGSQAGSDRQRS